MDIILLEKVEKLGSIGDVVTVKNGYARNFLLPNKKALRANAANKKVFEANRKQIEADNEIKRKEAEGASGNIDGKQVILIRASSASVVGPNSINALFNARADSKRNRLRVAR